MKVLRREKAGILPVGRRRVCCMWRECVCLYMWNECASFISRGKSAFPLFRVERVHFYHFIYMWKECINLSTEKAYLLFHVERMCVYYCGMNARRLFHVERVCVY